ncbi:ABC transporter permease subunit [Leifsonia sp. YIM 134122]|uniref:ABC transporter permease subunit n=1 Tax=Leifsonia stereocauli TaxID=3134136 RepID=A0ABU9W4Z5_9MICO
MSAALGPGRATRSVIGIVIGGLFAIPIIAMIEFTLRDGDGHSFAHWLGLLDPANAPRYAPIWLGLGNSLVLAVVSIGIVLLLLAPTMILITLRFPNLRRAFEFVVLLPISIPAIVLVVGLAPIYLVIGRTFGTGIWSLAFAYGITVLPYAYRAIQGSIDATDVRTLAEAARSLGAGWGSVLTRVLAPNLRPGLLAASLISVAVVLGEFTIASLLGRQNLQTALVVVSKQDTYAAIIVSLLALLFAFVLLVVIRLAGRRTSAGRKTASASQTARPARVGRPARTAPDSSRKGTLA